MNGAMAPPSWRKRLGESRALLDLYQGLTNPALRKVKSVKSETEAILLPGFGSRTNVMFGLRRTLTNLGISTFDWGVGFNNGDVPQLLEKFTAQLEARKRDSKAPALLVGWSLGGYIAREAARECPEAARHIITLGSPLVGGPKYTAVANWYRQRGYDLDSIERDILARYEQPLNVPVSAIYSKNDGVVDWRSCIDQWSTHAEHIEVRCSHLGMSISPETLSHVSKIAQRVARATR